MIARLIVVALLMLAGVACEKEVHEVRLEGVPQDRIEDLVPADV